MEGFTKQKKMDCFKEGGSVGYKSRKKHSEEKEMSTDVAQDKKIVKKAFSMHDEQKHEGKTNLSKLCGGGRAKTNGNVKRYKDGGAIGMQKTAGDKEKIKKIKQAKPVKESGLDQLVSKGAMFCGGGKA